MWMALDPTHLAGRLHIAFEPLAVVTAVSHRIGGGVAVGCGWGIFSVRCSPTQLWACGEEEAGIIVRDGRSHPLGCWAVAHRCRAYGRAHGRFAPYCWRCRRDQRSVVSNGSPSLVGSWFRKSAGVYTSASHESSAFEAHRTAVWPSCFLSGARSRDIRIAIQNRGSKVFIKSRVGAAGISRSARFLYSFFKRPPSSVVPLHDPDHGGGA